MIKLVAVDMDGTFLNSRNDYDRVRFARIHAKMTAMGIRFVVASGNQYAQLRSFFEAYPDTIYVAENGAYIRDARNTYALHTFTPAVTAQIAAYLSSDADLDSIACGVKSAYVQKTADPAYIKAMARYYFRLKQQETLEAPDDQIMKFGSQMAPARTQEYIEKYKVAFAGFAVPTSSGHGDIDIIQPGRHKAAGLAELGQVLNISLREMAAFGDGGNDLEMLREVGLGVAMKNAQPEVKAVADAVTTGSNDADGVCAFLEAYLSRQE